MLGGAAAAGPRVNVLAAENFYGDVARQIGGEHIDVSSILSNPNQDPHLFEITATIIRRVGTADVVLVNGAGYDHWIAQLLAVAHRPERIVITAAELVNKKPGDNPHLWYDPGTMPAMAQALTEALSKADPAHAADYRQRLRAFGASLTSINEKIGEIRAKYAGVAVGATEPVFGYMAAALQLQVRDDGFALAAMNDTEPTARQVASFERDLREHKIRVLLYNTQTNTSMTRRMVDIAHEVGVPVVGVSETQPSDQSYQQWILNELEALQRALAQSAT